jgi:putative addiction module killer protein
MNTLIRTEAFSSWLKGLKDAKAVASILARMDRAEKGNFGDSKSLKGGLSEMRIDVGAGYRVYFTQRGLTVYVLLAGGDKKSQARDIERAREMIKLLEAE